MSASILREIDKLLDEKWGDVFTFDRNLAENKGVVILRWKATNAALPLKIEISDKALEEGRLNWRELQRKIKLCLPENMMKQRISEANTLMRLANRRNLKDVEKDLKEWLENTAEDIRRIFGASQSKDFLVLPEVASQQRNLTTQMLHSLVEEKINQLKNLE